MLTIVAIVSLLVGGIGIMNIMLVSVTERTREIGIRKAIGAKRHNILTQFLLEALALSITGGLIGIMVGVGLTRLVTNLMGWQTLISIPSIMVSVIFAATVGIIFGLYPAWRAARQNTIEALRYE